MKASLRSTDGTIYPLPECATLGSSKSNNIFIASSAVDREHAAIDYNKDDGNFYLKDLQSAHGTYVNDTRVLNDIVQLNNHDTIRFGHGGPRFDFVVDNNVTYAPPLIDQQAWAEAQPKGNSYLPYIPTQQVNSLPPTTEQSPYAPLLNNYNTTLYHTTPSPSSNQGVTATGGITSSGAYIEGVLDDGQGISPHPPFHSRPFSAGGSVKFKIQTGGNSSTTNIQPQVSQITTRPMSAQLQPSIARQTNSRPTSAQQPTAEVASAPIPRPYSAVNKLSTAHQRMLHGKYTSPLSIASSLDPLTRMREMEMKIAFLEEELVRLSDFEFLCYEKDNIIASMKGEVLEQRGLSETESPAADNQQKLDLLQKQIAKKNEEISKLKAQLKDEEEAPPPAPETSANASTNHIAQLQTKLCNRDARIASLTSEVANLSKQKAQLSTLITGLQKDLDTKDQNMKKAKADAEKSRVIVRNKTSEITSLTKKLADQTAQAEAQLEQAKSNEDNKHLKNRLRSMEDKYKGKVAVCSDLENEIMRLKTSARDAEKAEHALKLELQSTSSQLTQMEKSEMKWKIEAQTLKKQYERLQHNLSKTLGSGNVSTIEEITTFVDKLGEDLKSTESRLETTVFDLEKLEQDNKIASECRDRLVEVAQNAELVLADGRSTAKLQAEIEKLQALDDVESVLWCKELIIVILTHELAWERSIEEALDAVVEQSPDGPQDRIGQLRKRLNENKEKIDQLEVNIVAAETSHKNMFKEYKEKTKESFQKKSQQTIEAHTKELKEEHEAIIKELKTIHQQELEEAIEEEKRKFEKEFGEVKELRNRLRELHSQEEEGATITERIASLQENLKASQENEASLQAELDSANLELTKEIEKVGEMKLIVEDYELYKEQAHQHSLTIVSLEEKLMKMSRAQKVCQQDLQAAQSQIESLTKKSKSPRRPKSAKIKEKTKEEDSSIKMNLLSNENIRIRSENKRLELQIECLTKQTSSDDRDEMIRSLRKDLMETKARLSDAAAELNEHQKQRIEEMEVAIKEKDTKIAELEGVIREMEEEKVLRDETESIEESKKDEESSSGKKLMRLPNTEHNMPVTVATPKRSTDFPPPDDSGCDLLQPSDLTRVGARCIGERHSSIIQKQKDALSAMRKTSSRYEQISPRGHSHEAAMQKLADARKEIENLQEEIEKRDIDAQRGDDELLAEVRIARELLATSQNENMMEKDSHQETKDALHLSEDMYLKLVRHLADLVGIQELDGCGPIAYSQVEDRNEILQERHKSLTMVVDKVKVMLNRLNRKEQLLLEYDNDLRALKSATSYGEQRDKEAVELKERIHQQEEEISCMREALKRTRLNLDEQTRKNVGLAKKKVYMMDVEKVQARKGHDCITPEQKEFQGQQKLRKKTEKLRRKDHEIHSLKKELQLADDRLVETQTQLKELESVDLYDDLDQSVDLNWVGQPDSEKNAQQTSFPKARTPESSVVNKTRPSSARPPSAARRPMSARNGRPSSAHPTRSDSGGSRSMFEYDVNEPPERDA